MISRISWESAGDPFQPPAQPLDAALDALASIDPDTLDDTALTDTVVELHRQQARLASWQPG
jgi:hypothetical protein